MTGEFVTCENYSLHEEILQGINYITQVGFSLPWLSIVVCLCVIVQGKLLNKRKNMDLWFSNSLLSIFLLQMVETYLCNTPFFLMVSYFSHIHMHCKQICCLGTKQPSYIVDIARVINSFLRKQCGFNFG